MITGIPEYRSPIEQSIRCVCGLRYVVFTGGSAFDGFASSAARERAEQMKSQFVDAREVPFMICACGLALDFTATDQAEVVM